MKDLPKGINAAQYLICDSRHPLSGASLLLDECVLHALDDAARDKVCTVFQELTGKAMTLLSRTDILSGGQKVLLMLLLALLSPARKICCIGLDRALDDANRANVKHLLAQYASTKEICLLEED